MKKELTDKQQDFLNNIPSCNGDLKEAAKKAGYSEHYQVTRALKTEIIEKEWIQRLKIDIFDGPKYLEPLVEFIVFNLLIVFFNVLFFRGKTQVSPEDNQHL